MKSPDRRRRRRTQLPNYEARVLVYLRSFPWKPLRDSNHVVFLCVSTRSSSPSSPPFQEANSPTSTSQSCHHFLSTPRSGRPRRAGPQQGTRESDSPGERTVSFLPQCVAVLSHLVGAGGCCYFRRCWAALEAADVGDPNWEGHRPLGGSECGWHAVHTFRGETCFFCFFFLVPLY